MKEATSELPAGAHRERRRVLAVLGHEGELAEAERLLEADALAGRHQLRLGRRPRLRGDHRVADPQEQVVLRKANPSLARGHILRRSGCLPANSRRWGWQDMKARHAQNLYTGERFSAHSAHKLSSGRRSLPSCDRMDWRKQRTGRSPLVLMVKVCLAPSTLYSSVYGLDAICAHGCVVSTMQSEQNSAALHELTWGYVELRDMH